MSNKRFSGYDGLVYDTTLWFFTVVTDLFFRDIHPRSSWRIPKTGPVLFVAAPHANQFIDPLIVARTVKKESRRRIAFLVAESSTRRPFIGFAARLFGTIPVARAMDLKKPGKGTIFLPDPEGDPTLIAGSGTDFTTSQFMKGGTLILPSVNGSSATAEIAEIISATEIRLKRPFKGETALKQLCGKALGEGREQLPNGDDSKEATGSFKGIEFKVTPHLDQSAVYDAVFDHIGQGGCVAIFPEGGSHDRTDLLEFKAGVALMALGSLAKDPTCNVKVVPIGLNYFHPHKFRSRCVVEFGQPIEVDSHLVEQYKSGDRRTPTGELLNTIYQSLKAITTSAPDYETLQLIQAVRRLYNPKRKRMPLSMVTELNRRLMKGYTVYKDDPRIVSLRKAVLDYNKTLFRLNIRDHQVAHAKFSWPKVVATLIWRVGKLAVLSIAVLPGTVLFSPIFIIGRYISRKKAAEALAASSVKVKARDVLATWKVLVALALTPVLDVLYSVLLWQWACYDRVWGLVPQLMPPWTVGALGLIIFPTICYMALRFGEIGMDIVKSLPPLMLSINPTSSNTLVRLRKRRAELVERLNAIIDELGPELFDDFEKERLVHDSDRWPTSPQSSRPTTPTHGSDPEMLKLTPSTPPPMRRNQTLDRLPRNESFKNIGSIGLFASRPSTPNMTRSRTNSSDGSKLQGFSQIEKRTDMDEVSNNLHTAMRERGRRRTDDHDNERDGGALTSMEDAEPEEAKKEV